jgi:hypothetical protein
LREVSNELSIRRQRVRCRSVERVALEQLDKALEHTKAKTKLDEAVHDVRVFKKLRGLIRLVRDELGDKQYKRENVFYRDLNRRLSKVRDTAALTEVLTRLEERFAEELTENAFGSVRRSFTRATRKRQAEKKRALVQVRKKLIAARKRVKKWSIKDSCLFSRRPRANADLLTKALQALSKECFSQGFLLLTWPGKASWHIVPTADCWGGLLIQCRIVLRSENVQNFHVGSCILKISVP